jgi:broad specificity phosphatase PhoE
MTRFLLIRHALNDTIGKKFAGRMAGVSLNDEGNAQSIELARRLAARPIAAIYSSPLERAIATVRPLAEELKLTVETVDEFTELDMGKWTGCGFDEVRAQAYFLTFNQFRSCTPAPDGELMLQAQARMVSGLLKLRAKHEGETIAVVSHADPIKSAICYFAGMPLDLYHRFEISPVSVSVVELETDSVNILTINSTGEF